MDTNIALRLHAWRLIQLGMNQKVVAARMGMSESKFSRWLRKRSKVPASVAALDGLRTFLRDLQREASWDGSALTREELEQLESEIGAVETEHSIKRQIARSQQKKATRTGKKLAKR